MSAVLTLASPGLQVSCTSSACQSRTEAELSQNLACLSLQIALRTAHCGAQMEQLLPEKIKSPCNMLPGSTLRGLLLCAQGTGLIRSGGGRCQAGRPETGQAATSVWWRLHEMQPFSGTLTQLRQIHAY